MEKDEFKESLKMDVPESSIDAQEIIEKCNNSKIPNTKLKLGLGISCL